MQINSRFKRKHRCGGHSSRSALRAPRPATRRAPCRALGFACLRAGKSPRAMPVSKPSHKVTPSSSSPSMVAARLCVCWACMPQGRPLAPRRADNEYSIRQSMYQSHSTQRVRLALQSHSQRSWAACFLTGPPPHWQDHRSQARGQWDAGPTVAATSSSIKKLVFAEPETGL